MARSASRRAMSWLPGGSKSAAPARVRADSGLDVSSSRPTWTFSRSTRRTARSTCSSGRAGTYEVEQPLAEAERIRQFNVDPSTQGERARLGVGLGDAVHGDEERDRPVVRHHCSGCNVAMAYRRHQSLRCRQVGRALTTSGTYIRRRGRTAARIGGRHAVSAALIRTFTGQCIETGPSHTTATTSVRVLTHKSIRQEQQVAVMSPNTCSPTPEARHSRPPEVDPRTPQPSPPIPAQKPVR
jgi:hypothetical protein